MVVLPVGVPSQNLVPPQTQFDFPGPTGGRPGIRGFSSPPKPRKVFPYITVSAYGIGDVKPDGTVVDEANDGADFGPDTPNTQTSGIREAINYTVSQGGGRIFARKGIYNITAPFSATYDSNRVAMLQLPTVQSGPISIELEGEANAPMPPNASMSAGLNGNIPPENNGTIFYFIPQSLPSAPSSPPYYHIFFVNPYYFLRIKNITMRQPSTSNMVNGPYLEYASWYEIDNLKIDIDIAYNGNGTLPSSTIPAPPPSTGFMSNAENVTTGSPVIKSLNVTYYYVGVQLLSQVTVERLQVGMTNSYGLLLTPSFHTITILHYETVGVAIPIAFAGTGSGNGPRYILSTDIQHTPPNYTGWNASSTDIYFVTSAVGYLKWSSVTAEVGTDTKFPSISGSPTGYIIDVDTAITVSVTTPIVPASAAAEQNTNPYSVEVYLYGGAITEVQITKQGTVYTVFSSATATAMAGQAFRLDPGDSITLTYSTAPSWAWLPA